MKKQSKVIRNISEIPTLPRTDVEELIEVTQTFEFRVTSYYASLIDWSDPNDPLRRIVLPNLAEIESDWSLDASGEFDNTIIPGLQHKYEKTALLLVNDVCAAYCRFCFRKRFTLSKNSNNQIILDPSQYEKETTYDISEGIKYINNHPEIDNVLLTGGDPLMLSIERLNKILTQVRQISHVQVVRIGTKVPAFDPERLTDEFVDMLASHIHQDAPLYLMVHFNHPREITLTAQEKLRKLIARGITIFNQTPLLKGINDEPNILGELFTSLINNGITPYYLFHCRPTKGNESFMLSFQDGARIVKETRRRLNGLAKCFHYVGSHRTGKIEIVGEYGDFLLFRYHQPKNSVDQDRVFLWPISKPIEWFDALLDKHYDVLETIF